jgi:hypothetical protein
MTGVEKPELLHDPKLVPEVFALHAMPQFYVPDAPTDDRPPS